MTSPFDIHNIYNARYFSLEQIVKSFIPSEQFYKAAKDNHSLVIGPRGCGKTTIFKMLTYGAKCHLEEKEKKLEINFFAIYIPADRQWLKQQEKLKELLPGQNHEPLLNYFLISNTIISVINAIEDVINYNSVPSDRSISLENKIVRNIVSTLRMEYKGIASFFFLKEHLYLTTRLINEAINKYKYQVIQIEDIKYPDLSYSQLMDVLSPLRISVIEAVKGEKEFAEISKKWCLCFDELEIAPKWVSKELINTLFRSVDQNFIFKLTSTPIIELNLYNKANASIGHDYEIIECWVKNKASYKMWEDFCHDYLNKNTGILFPYKIFGNFEWEGILNGSDISNKGEEEKKYSRNSTSYRVFKELAIKDESFKNFLEKKKINPTDPVPKNAKERDQIFRKIKPIVYSRFLFKKADGKFRPRKNAPIFFGFDYIVEMCDGNVRSYLSVLSKFKDFLDKDQPIPRNLQSKEIREFSNNYYLGIKNYTEGYVDGTKYSLFKLIGTIAKYFSNEIYGDEFTMDPTGSFSLDSKIDEKIMEVVKAGILNGHIIIKKTEYVSSKHGVLDENFLSSVINKPLRLSYLIYPFFNLPKREFGNANLRAILHKEHFQGQTNMDFFK